MAKKKRKKELSEVPNFEEALERLEGIVHLLEEGDVGLDEALARYEEGVRLLRQSYNLLEKAERRIELLSGVDADGNPTTEPFDDRATVSADDSGPKRRAARRATETRGANPGRERPPLGHNDIDSADGLF